MTLNILITLLIFILCAGIGYAIKECYSDYTFHKQIYRHKKYRKGNLLRNLSLREALSGIDRNELANLVSDVLDEYIQNYILDEYKERHMVELESECVGVITDRCEFIRLQLKLFIEFGERREGERLINKKCTLPEDVSLRVTGVQ